MGKEKNEAKDDELNAKYVGKSGHARESSASTGGDDSKRKQSKKKRKREQNNGSESDPEVQLTPVKKVKKERSDKKKSAKDKPDGSSKKKRKKNKVEVEHQAGFAENDLGVCDASQQNCIANAAEKDQNSAIKKGKKGKGKEKKKKKRKSESNCSDSLHHVNAKEAGNPEIITQKGEEVTVVDTDSGEMGKRVISAKTTIREPNHTRKPSSVEESNTEANPLQTVEENRPTTSEIFRQVSKKRKGFLHGHAAIPLLSPEQVNALDEAGTHVFIKKSATLCERLAHLMHDLIIAANQWTKIERKDDFITIEEALTGDMARLRKFPLARQYVEMTLWRRIVQLNQDHVQAASKTGFGKGLSSSGGAQDQGLLLFADNDPDAEFVSYREAHMQGLVSRFEESLEKLRERENMDSERAQFLLKCLDAGSNLYGNLQCLDKREHEGNQ